jgi:hypothetical protein
MNRLVVLALAAASSSVIHYTASSMHVVRTVAGSCWTGSIASNRSDAYRCMAGNSIHDPCFALARDSVACPEDLVADSGIVMKLTTPLPAAQSPPAQPQAWALLLQGDAPCLRATGTLEDPDYPFYCKGHPDACRIDLSKPQKAYFARCATFERRKPAHVTSTLVKIVYL